LNHFSPPLLIQKLFGNFIWSTTNNKILLTFDDGPTEAVTIKILNILKANNIKSIFFCVGNNIKKHPSLVQNIIDDGHLIANHTMSHKMLTKMSREESIREIGAVNDLMKEKFNYIVKYCRPPYGRFNLKTNNILNELNMNCIMWNLLSFDYQNNIVRVKYAIDNHLNKNSIIVFHDNVKCSNIIEEALNYTIAQAEKKGYEFGEPEDCLK